MTLVLLPRMNRKPYQCNNEEMLFPPRVQHGVIGMTRNSRQPIGMTDIFSSDSFSRFSQLSLDW